MMDGEIRNETEQVPYDTRYLTIRQGLHSRRAFGRLTRLMAGVACLMKGTAWIQAWFFCTIASFGSSRRATDGSFRGTDGLLRGVDGLFSGADGLSRGTDNLFRGADELFRGTDESLEGTEDPFLGTDELFPSAEDMLVPYYQGHTDILPHGG